MLEQKYFFTASTDNKWSEFTFDRWKVGLMLLALQHVVVRYSAMETSANYKDGGKKLFEPSTSKISSLDTPRGRASKFLPRIPI